MHRAGHVCCLGLLPWFVLCRILSPLSGRMTAIISTEELERIIVEIANCKQDAKNESSGQKMQGLVRDGLGVLLHIHTQYIEQCKSASAASNKVAEQKTSYEKGLLALQNKRFVTSCATCCSAQVVVWPTTFCHSTIAAIQG